MVSRKHVLGFCLGASLFALDLGHGASAKPQPGDPDRLLEPLGVASAPAAPVAIAARPGHADALMAPRDMAAFDRLPIAKAPNHPDGLMEPTEPAAPQHRRTRAHR
ncbi:MAG: hypothetical protein IT370_25745 [Deltaproteobacteria bacterium]|nr:hypothetical protein [Deltaproteobacteria bacterium]